MATDAPLRPPAPKASPAGSTGTDYSLLHGVHRTAAPQEKSLITVCKKGISEPLHPHCCECLNRVLGKSCAFLLTEGTNLCQHPATNVVVLLKHEASDKLPRAIP